MHSATDLALKLGKVLGHYKMGRHFAHQIEDRKLNWWRPVENDRARSEVGWDLCDSHPRDGGTVIGGRYGARLQEEEGD